MSGWVHAQSERLVLLYKQAHSISLHCNKDTTELIILTVVEISGIYFLFSLLVRIKVLYQHWAFWVSFLTVTPPLYMHGD